MPLSGQPLTSYDRLLQLKEAILNLEDNFQNFQKKRETRFLKQGSIQLRALIADKRSLLLELAIEHQMDLTVYTINPQYKQKSLEYGAVIMLAIGAGIYLEEDGLHRYQTTLSDAIKQPNDKIDGHIFTVAEIIRLVADKDAAHYDTVKTAASVAYSQVTYGEEKLDAHYKIVEEMSAIVIAFGKFLLTTVAVKWNGEGAEECSNTSPLSSVNDAINSLQSGHEKFEKALTLFEKIWNDNLYIVIERNFHLSTVDLNHWKSNLNV